MVPKPTVEMLRDMSGLALSQAAIDRRHQEAEEAVRRHNSDPDKGTVMKFHWGWRGIQFTATPKSKQDSRK